jgi:hypothetical protein
MTAKTPLEIVNEQAEDEGLWFVAQTAPESYLQQELRRLHAAVERLAFWKKQADEEREQLAERLHSQPAKEQP